MKKLLQIPLLFVALFLTSIPISAHDFEVDGIYYNILTDSTVWVTYQGADYSSVTGEYSGSISIPESVTYSDTTYYVTGIAGNTFLGCNIRDLVIQDGSKTLYLEHYGYYKYNNTYFYGSLFNDCQLKSIYLGRNISYQNSSEAICYPFYNQTTLTSLTIGNSVTSIGKWSFYGCSGLTEITIPRSVSEFYANAFYGCTGLTTINVENGNSIIDSRNNCNAIIETGTNTLIYGCKNTTIPNTVTSIASSAFEGCNNLTSVNIPNSVTTIASSAFENCTSLSEVNICDLSAWCKIDFSDYDANPLYYADSLKLNGTVITDLVIPDDITEIKSYAFNGCDGLKSVTIHNTITKISDTSFKGCSGLVEMIVEEGNPNYFSYEGVIYRTSDSCPIITPSGMDKYVVPNFLDRVYLCSSSGFEVKLVEIPEGFAASSVSVGSYCDSLESLVIKEPLDTIIFHGKNLERAVNLKKLILPTKMNCKSLTIHQTKKVKHSYTNSYTYTYTFHPIVTLQVPKLNIFSYIYSYDGSSYSRDSFTIINGSLCSEKEYSSGTKYSVYLPLSLKLLILTDQTDFYNDTDEVWYKFYGTAPIDDYYIQVLKPVTNFASETFAYSAIKDVIIESVEIPTNAFVNSKVENITIKNSNSQMTIPAGLFRNCANLKSLTLPFPGTGTAQTTSNFGELFGTEANSNMRAVTQYFEDGTNKTYYLPTGLEELVLTEGCEMIPYGGLYNCNMLKKLTLPTSLYMVGDKALYGCAQIADIYCKGADPAVAYDSSFDGMRLTSCKLHVPYNSSERYKISDGWKRFYYIEEEAPLVVSIAKNIENAGVVYGINEYQPGQVAEVEAVAHSGYTFVGWYENGNLLTTDSKYTVMVTDSHSLVAMFVPVLDENDVEVSPKAENVTLLWAQETGAEYYNIDIYSNAAMTMPVGSMVVDNSGQPVSRSATTVSATIDGLSELQNYYYSITAYGAEETILSKYTGSFSTIAGIEGVMGDTNAVEVARYDIHGRLLSAPVKGINIVKYSDGTVKKIIIN